MISLTIGNTASRKEGVLVDPSLTPAQAFAQAGFPSITGNVSLNKRILSVDEVANISLASLGAKDNDFLLESVKAQGAL